MLEPLRMTTGQMAKLHKTTKRLLQYYDEIGLFSPSWKGENEYRYYTYDQSPELEIILSLSEMGMKLLDIKEYLKTRSVDSFQLMISEKQRELQEQIKNLQNIDHMISEHLKNLEKIRGQATNQVFIERQEEEVLLTTEELHDTRLEKIYQTISETLLKAEEKHLYCHMFGSILPEASWKNMNFVDYTKYYFKTTARSFKAHSYTKDAGNYLCLHWQGHWDTLHEGYGLLIEYAKHHRLELVGDAYEDNLVDDLMALNEEESITKIMIRIQ